MKKKIICVIPARKNSKRLKLKNIKKIGNYSLVEHAILQAKKSKIFNKIFVSTDILSLKKVCNKHKVEFFYRRKFVDKSSAVSLATYDVIKQNKIDKNYDYVIQLMATCPLRKSSDIKHSFLNFIKNNYDFQISAFKISWLHFSWAYVFKKKDYFKFFKFKKKIDDTKIIFPTGAIWIAKLDKFMKSKTFYGPKFKFFEINWISALDIDTKHDFENAKVIYKLFKN